MKVGDLVVMSRLPGTLWRISHFHSRNAEQRDQKKSFYLTLIWHTRDYVDRCTRPYQIGETGRFFVTGCEQPSGMLVAALAAEGVL